MTQGDKTYELGKEKPKKKITEIGRAEHEHITAVTQRGAIETPKKDSYIKTFDNMEIHNTYGGPKGENPKMPDWDNIPVKKCEPMCWFCWNEKEVVVYGKHHEDQGHFTCDKHKGMIPK